MKRIGNLRPGLRRRPVFVVFAVIPVLAVWLSFAGLVNAQWIRLDQHRFPWAYAESGRPTLTGTWAGTLTTTQGTRRGLLLDLRLVPLKFPAAGRRTGGFDLRFFHRRGSDNLTGALHLCGGPNGEQHFTLRGNVVANDASRVQLSLTVADSLPPDGLAPRTLRGTWNGRDSLGVDADLYVRAGSESIINPRDPETTTPQPGVLHRAERVEFPTLCERLWTRR